MQFTLFSLFIHAIRNAKESLCCFLLAISEIYTTMLFKEQ